MKPCPPSTRSTTAARSSTWAPSRRPWAPACALAGWSAAPELIRRVSALKVDGGTNVFGAHVAADWLPERSFPTSHRLRERLSAPPRPDARRTRAAHAPWLDLDRPRWRVLHLGDAAATESTRRRMQPQVQERGVEYLPGAPASPRPRVATNCGSPSRSSKTT